MQVGEAIGLLGACSWGITSLIVRQSAGRADPLRLNAAMQTVAALVIGAVLLVLGALGVHHIAFGPGTWVALGYLAIAGGCNFAIGNSAYFLALRRLGVARAMPLTLVQPLLAAMLATALLGERLTLGLVLGVLLIPAGVYLVAAPRAAAGGTTKVDRLGLALGLATPLAWALGAVALRPALAGLDALTAAALRAAMGAPLLAALGWAAGRDRSGWPHPRLALVGGLPFATATLFFTFSVGAVGAARATALSSTAPLFALPMAALWLGERVTRRTVAGTLLALAGVLLVVGA